MQFRIGSFLLVIVALAPPIYAGCEGWKAGCLLTVLLVWVVFIGIPLIFLICLRPVATPEDEPVKIMGIYVALLVIPYLVSFLLSIGIIGSSRPLILPW